MKRTSLSRKTPLRRTAWVKKPSKIAQVKKKKPSIGKLKKDLDAVFSRYIRYRDGGQCFTCPKKDDPKHMQNGHFVPRQYLAVRWDEKNCNCQCYACNMLYNGQGPTYAVRLKQKYGEGIVEELEKRRWEVIKLTPEWYRDKILYYTQMLERAS